MRRQVEAAGDEALAQPRRQQLADLGDGVAGRPGEDERGGDGGGHAEGEPVHVVDGGPGGDAVDHAAHEQRGGGARARGGDVEDDAEGDAAAFGTEQGHVGGADFAGARDGQFGGHVSSLATRAR